MRHNHIHPVHVCQGLQAPLNNPYGDHRKPSPGPRRPHSNYVRRIRVSELGKCKTQSVVVSSLPRKRESSMANGDCLPVDCFASHFVGSRVRGNDGWIRSFALPSSESIHLVARGRTCYIDEPVRPRSSADRALASGARCVGSSPAGGTLSFHSPLQRLGASFKRSSPRASQSAT